ncbi:hypothetical protein NFX39_01715 [Fructobacillus sp. W13]|uniref:Uncharacterized protein n=1 Tax=Fructobacillus apis TaxID=2935017 RepID=A0ABT0ZP96_9LACO|nr:hypothetical protein [Fructobacillus apis]MCO0831811.1 hypothetical protein [Fructobacillus apis]
MIRKRTAFILLPTITLIMLLTVFYLAQGKIFVNRLENERLLIERTKVDCVQISASRDYLLKQQTKGKRQDYAYEIDEEKHQITIHSEKVKHHRPLLGKKPTK